MELDEIIRDLARALRYAQDARDAEGAEYLAARLKTWQDRRAVLEEDA
jgi:hypothetical protein